MVHLMQTWAITVLCAELFLILARTNEIKALFKNRGQNTREDRIIGDLRTSLVLELLLFVPASALLVLVTLPPMLWIRFKPPTDQSLLFSIYGLLGITSYGFPFAAIRRLVTRIALGTLREFATITVPPIEDPTVTMADQRLEEKS